MATKKGNGIKRRINIDIRDQSVEDENFLKLYDLISDGKKKETLYKALKFFIKKENEEIIDDCFKDNTEEAIVIAKTRPKRTIKKVKKVVKKVETKPKEVKILEENETETEEVVEVKPPIKTIPIEENIEPDVVIKEEKTEVTSDTPDDAIKEDSTAENEVMGSSTTQEKEGDFFKKKKKKKKENEGKNTRTDEQKKAEHDKRMAEIIKNAEEADARSEASEKEKMVKWNKD